MQKYFLKILIKIYIDMFERGYNRDGCCKTSCGISISSKNPKETKIEIQL